MWCTVTLELHLRQATDHGATAMHYAPASPLPDLIWHVKLKSNGRDQNIPLWLGIFAKETLDFLKA
jgi:hypothetical protein